MTTSEVALRAITSLWTGVVCVDLDGVILSANGAYATMMASAPEALMGRSIHELAQRDRNLPFFEGLEKTLRDGETRRIRSDSGDFDRVFDNIITRSGDLVIIEVADVTDEVREHERRQQIQSARDVIWSRVVEHFVVVDLVGRNLTATPTVRQRWPIHGFERAVQLGSILNGPRSQHSWTDPWTSPSNTFDGRIERTVAEVFESGMEQRHQTLIPIADGRARYFDTQLVPWSVNDRPRGVVIIVHDLTEQYRALERRSYAADAMAQLLASLPVTVWEVDVADVTLRPLFADRRRPVDPDWGTFRPIVEALSDLDDDSRSRLARAVIRLATDGNGAVQVANSAGDRRMQVSLRVSGAHSDERRLRAHAVIVDVTQQVNEREAQERVDRATHLMGFAEGVAKELESVAQQASGYLELLTHAPDKAARERAAAELAAAASGAVAVSRRLAPLATMGRLKNGPIDLGQVAGEHLPVLQRQVGPGIEVTLHSETGLRALGDPTTVAQALDDLCRNAAEAMAGEGSITITVRPITDRGQAFVEMAVADDGPGFEPAMLSRAFEPFASWRPDHLTGLGLYLIKVYLNSLGGETRVESTHDGATVRLWFPVVH